MITVSVFTVLLLIILFSFFFALSNGLHDASSVVATIITSGAASPKGAVLLASVFGMIGALFGGSMVADTVSSIIDLPASSSLLPVLLSAVTGAVLWNMITWKFGLPSSSTHALVGGIVGAVLVSSGAGHVLWGLSELTAAGPQVRGIVKIVLSLLISPVIGFAAAWTLEKLAKILLRNAKFTINRRIKKLQWAIAAGLSLAHGANDTQKILGLIVLALVSGGTAPLHSAPVWARLCLGALMFLGTMLGGWKIMKTVGRGIFELEPIHSLSSQLASAGSILAANFMGAPVSSTHIVVGSVMGVGSAENYKMVNWNIVREIVLSWVITIPASAAVSALLYLIISRVLNLV
ncbi:MAG TPA: inorganic phosphate transporter [Armatimonadota bacterium]|nr:inorganic phosphate transporter [Armatimonadota bacterium]